MNFVVDIRSRSEDEKVERGEQTITGEGGEEMVEKGEETIDVDEEDKLHCSVKKDLVGQFEQTVEQGVTKVMVNFIVTQSGSHRSSVWPMELFLNSCMISRPLLMLMLYFVLYSSGELIGEKVTY
ncbi:hypothetical protein Bca101_010634 [Brassica carinata]